MVFITYDLCIIIIYLKVLLFFGAFIKSLDFLGLIGSLLDLDVFVSGKAMWFLKHKEFNFVVYDRKDPIFGRDEVGEISKIIE